MKSLKRDITFTLILKLILLFLLWWVCFRGVEKPTQQEIKNNIINKLR